MIVCLCSNLNEQAIRDKVRELRKLHPGIKPEEMIGDPAIHVRCGGCREEMLRVIKEVYNDA